jgi:hypothetical protein
VFAGEIAGGEETAKARWREGGHEGIYLEGFLRISLCHYALAVLDFAIKCDGLWVVAKKRGSA